MDMDVTKENFPITFTNTRQIVNRAGSLSRLSEQTVVNSSTIVGCNLLEGSVMPYCVKRLDFELERERSNRALWLTKSNGSCWNRWRNKKSLYENSKLPKPTMFRYDWLFIFFVTDNYCSFFFFSRISLCDSSLLTIPSGKTDAFCLHVALCIWELFKRL